MQALAEGLRVLERQRGRESRQRGQPDPLGFVEVLKLLQHSEKRVVFNFTSAACLAPLSDFGAR
jgi:hypothetical protein